MCNPKVMIESIILVKQNDPSWSCLGMTPNTNSNYRKYVIHKSYVGQRC